MPHAIDRAGNFRAEITEYGLQEYDSGAVAIALKALITAEWNRESGEWDDWTQYEATEATGYVNIVKKDGSANKNQVEALIQFAGWDGKLSSVANQEWQTTPCQIVVNAEVYKNQTQYKISFINDFERTPGGFGNVDPDKAKSLDSKYGNTLRAIAGNVRRGKPADVKGRPASPPKKKSPAEMSGGDVNSELQEAADLPF